MNALVESCDDMETNDLPEELGRDFTSESQFKSFDFNNMECVGGVENTAEGKFEDDGNSQNRARFQIPWRESSSAKSAVSNREVLERQLDGDGEPILMTS